MVRGQDEHKEEMECLIQPGLLTTGRDAPFPAKCVAAAKKREFVFFSDLTLEAADAHSSASFTLEVLPDGAVQRSSSSKATLSSERALSAATQHSLRRTALRGAFGARWPARRGAILGRVCRPRPDFHRAWQPHLGGVLPRCATRCCCRSRDGPQRTQRQALRPANCRSVR